jgi:hypothetical protein
MQGGTAAGAPEEFAGAELPGFAGGDVTAGGAVEPAVADVAVWWVVHPAISRTRTKPRRAPLPRERRGHRTDYRLRLAPPTT